MRFPISRDPPEGGTSLNTELVQLHQCFQFLGIPPKGELEDVTEDGWPNPSVSNF